MSEDSPHEDSPKVHSSPLEPCSLRVTDHTSTLPLQSPNPPGGPGPRGENGKVSAEVSSKLHQLRNMLLQGADFGPISLLDDIMCLCVCTSLCFDFV